MYTDKEFRNKVVANVTDISVKSFWLDEYAKYTDKYAQEATPAIQNKIGQFAGNPLIRNIIGQSKSSFDLRKIMDEKKIMIVNLSKGRVGEGNARLLGSMLITKLYLAAMSRSDEKALALAKLPQFYLFVDEFQSFADRSFADILSEARKYKLNLTIAHQYIEQMEEEVRDAVFGNVGTMIVFRVGAYDADVLEKEFTPTFLAEDLVSLGLRQIYLKLMIDSVTSQPFSATTLPPIKPQEVSYVDEIIENSRKTFSKPRGEVEKNIADWHEEGRVAPKTFVPKAGATPVPITRPLVTRLSEKKPTPMAPPPKPAPFVVSTQARPVPKSTDFRTPATISLENLKKKEDNQRKPDAKHLADLRSALKTVVGEKMDKKDEKKTDNVPVKPLGGSTSKLGPSSEELKKILDVK
jgi:hypothetical protein